MEQMGWFPVKFSQGNSYVMVLYDYDSIAILTLSIKNRTKEAMDGKHKEVNEILISQGICSQVKILDNEFSKVLPKFV